MGLYNQGWGCRCDHCGDQAADSIGGLPRLDMIRLAKRQGWIQRKEKWFCSEYCQAAWLARQPSVPEGER